MSEEMKDNKTSIVTAYKPSELIAIFNATLGRQNEFAKLVSLRGIYQQRQNSQNWSFAYAGLRDESSQDEITLRMPKELFETLANGNLITVIGILERKIDPRGSIQITLNVTRVEKLQEQAVSEADQKKAKLRRYKAQTGFRNVDGVIEQRLLVRRSNNAARTASRPPRQRPRCNGCLRLLHKNDRKRMCGGIVQDV